MGSPMSLIPSSVRWPSRGPSSLLGKPADGQPAQPDPTRHIDRLVEHCEPGFLALTHGHKSAIVRILASPR